MRCVIQRVRRASVTVEGNKVGKIGQGLLVLVGVGKDDSDFDVEWIGEKIAGLRIFEDMEGKFNLSLADIQGEILLVSQFTLYADCRKGRRPSFSDAARGSQAENLIEMLRKYLQEKGYKVETGQFQANMDVELINQGPVTILLDSKKQF